MLEVVIDDAIPAMLCTTSNDRRSHFGTSRTCPSMTRSGSLPNYVDWERLLRHGELLTIYACTEDSRKEYARCSSPRAADRFAIGRIT
jgi:hypothetical protein